MYGNSGTLSYADGRIHWWHCWTLCGFWLLSCQLVFAQEGTFENPPDKLALLVGVGEYLRPEKFATLNYSETDAVAIKGLLESSGYEVVELLGSDANQASLLTELERVATRVKPRGKLVLGFFGHGVQYGRQAYFCPFDANVRQVTNADGQKLWTDDQRPLLEPDPTSLVSMSQILAAFRLTDASDKWLLADCCRDQPNQPRGGLGDAAFGGSIEVQHLPMNAAAMFACSEGERAYESADWGHGAFTRAILDATSESEQNTVNELSVSVFRKVRALVAANGKSQTVHTVINGGIIDLGLVHPLKRQSAFLSNRSLRQSVSEIAHDFVDVLRERSIDEVAIQPVIDETTGNFGPGLQHLLTEILREQGIKLTPDAATKISGQIVLTDNENDRKTPEFQRLLAAELRLRLFRGQEVLVNRFAFINRSSEIAQVAGVTVDFGVESLGVRDAHRRIREQVGLLTAVVTPADAKIVPQFTAQGSRIRVNQDSPIAVEIMVGNGDSETARTTARSPSLDQPYPLVPIQSGEFYEVKLHNDSAQEYAIALSIDGLDQFTFSEERDSTTGQPLFTHWIVPAKSSVAVPGWHITSDPSRSDHFKRFLVTEYGEGASKYRSHADKSQIGVITIAISEAYPINGVSRSSRTETGLGPDISKQQQKVERKVEPPHAIIAIRYQKPGPG